MAFSNQRGNGSIHQPKWPGRQGGCDGLGRPRGARHRRFAWHRACHGEAVPRRWRPRRDRRPTRKLWRRRRQAWATTGGSAPSPPTWARWRAATPWWITRSPPSARSTCCSPTPAVTSPRRWARSRKDMVHCTKKTHPQRTSLRASGRRGTAGSAGLCGDRLGRPPARLPWRVGGLLRGDGRGGEPDPAACRRPGTGGPGERGGTGAGRHRAPVRRPVRRIVRRFRRCRRRRAGRQRRPCRCAGSSSRTRSPGRCASWPAWSP